MVFVRAGSADLFGEFGRYSVDVGDAVLIGPSVSCGAVPDGLLTFTTVAVDTDYAIDQVFWQHAEVLRDKYDAEDFAATLYPDSFQVMRLGAQFGDVVSSLDELVALSRTGQYRERFNRMQSLWFSVADILALHLSTVPFDAVASSRAPLRNTRPHMRRFVPIRAEAQAAAYLLENEPARRWTLDDLAAEVHLSRSHLAFVFAATFGKPPMAYLSTIRAKKMAKYLRETDLPVETVLRMVGWRSRTHAAQVFREFSGVNPSEYRRLRARVF
ncbi:helix-turn-helix transcriptional regulator [Microbacterium sp. J1-1]|uniref:helix-turn-helix transcriptional regulator n=1 Tax=Microbacterium sp. J1-1 TaxID=2992441 RepID=UPI0021145945|nr:helix-turn-helix domain-containing protein [Microbacterium sp. J1-1]UUE19381.1 helix-turn-helix transcriptional regulator [Microbacterium sp. J1-1]